MAGSSTNGIISGRLKTIGRPKITGSLILNRPGASDRRATCFADFCLEKMKIAISNEIVLPVPPTMPKVGTKMLLMMCGIGWPLAKASIFSLVLISRNGSSTTLLTTD